MALAIHVPESEVALARACVWKLIGSAFRAPDARWAAELGAHREAIAYALETALEGEDLAAARGRIERLAADAADVAGRARDYARHIGHTPRAGAIPYETEWTQCAGELRQFHELADIAAFYRAVGLEPSATSGERVDHVVVETSFLHFLCAKEAWAEEQGQTDLAAASREIEARFLTEHLARWAPAFCRRLARADARGSLGAAAELLALWLQAECARLGASSGDPTLEPGASSTRLEDTCVSCEQSAACALRPSGGDPLRAQP